MGKQYPPFAFVAYLATAQAALINSEVDQDVRRTTKTSSSMQNTFCMTLHANWSLGWAHGAVELMLCFATIWRASTLPKTEAEVGGPIAIPGMVKTLTMCQTSLQ